jgi:hypothetical protein
MAVTEHSHRPCIHQNNPFSSASRRSLQIHDGSCASLINTTQSFFLQRGKPPAILPGTLLGGSYILANGQQDASLPLMIRWMRSAVRGCLPVRKGSFQHLSFSEVSLNITVPPMATIRSLVQPKTDWRQGPNWRLSHRIQPHQDFRAENSSLIISEASPTMRLSMRTPLATAPIEPPACWMEKLPQASYFTKLSNTLSIVLSSQPIPTQTTP